VEKRRQALEDVEKRREFRRVHGIEDGGVAGWFGGNGAEGERVGKGEEVGDAKRKPVRKWLGIW